MPQFCLDCFRRIIIFMFEITDQIFTAPFGLISVVTIILIVTLLVLTVRGFYLLFLKRNFLDSLDIDASLLPRKTKIRRSRDFNSTAYFSLSFPHWTFGNKDGTRDKRRTYNRIEYPGCNLSVDRFNVRIKCPVTMIEFINVLRKHDITIKQHNLEQQKHHTLQTERIKLSKMNSLDNLVTSFEANPFEFEKFCAKLFEAMGLTAKTTSATNDGGYDIIVNFPSGKKALVECKCYRKNSVGRPAIQKLVGANVDVNAQRLIFITTSKYSNEAEVYAEKANVELIDGFKLLSLINKYISPEKVNASVTLQEWSLIKADLKPHIPSDIYYNL